MYRISGAVTSSNSRSVFDSVRVVLFFDSTTNRTPIEHYNRVEVKGQKHCSSWYREWARPATATKRRSWTTRVLFRRYVRMLGSNTIILYPNRIKHTLAREAYSTCDPNTSVPSVRLAVEWNIDSTLTESKRSQVIEVHCTRPLCSQELTTLTSRCTYNGYVGGAEDF